MTIRHFTDIHSIRKEIRRIEFESTKDISMFSALKRVLINNKNTLVVASSKDVTTRDTYSEKPVLETKTEKVQKSSIQKMTQMLHERQERQELAEHILFLLKNNFADEDGAVIKKLTELSQQLVDQTQKLAVGADTVLNDQGEKLAPKDFKNDVVSIVQTLGGDFNFNTNTAPVKYYVGVDKFQEEGRVEEHLYYMAYIYLQNLKGSDIVRDVYIVCTRRKNPRGDTSDYIRTFFNYVNPSNLLKSNLGTQYDNTNRASEIVLRSLKLDKFIDTINPSQIPVKKDLVKFNNPAIARTVVDDKNGQVKIFLNESITDKTQADKVLQDVFVEIKNIVKSIHPRNRNPVKATQPKLVSVIYRNSKGTQTKKKQFVFKLLFSKPEEVGKTSLELPRDKVEQFNKILDIKNPESAKHFNTILKKFIGV